MVKRIILLFSILVFVFLGSTPAFAQTPTPPQRHGFFTDIAQFFGDFFQNHGAPTKILDQITPGVTAAPRDSDVKHTMMPIPSGGPTSLTLEEYRLTNLVDAGKITAAQKDAIMAELSKVQGELKTWAQTEGIDPTYVLGGPMMGGGGMMRPYPATSQGGNQGSGNGRPNNMMYRQGGGEEGTTRGNQPQEQPQNQ